MRTPRARQGPVVFFAPLVFPHHKNLHRLLVLHVVCLPLQERVVPLQRHLILINRQLLSEIHTPHFPVVRPTRVSSDVNHKPLSVFRSFSSRFPLQSRNTDRGLWFTSE